MDDVAIGDEHSNASSSNLMRRLSDSQSEAHPALPIMIGRFVICCVVVGTFCIWLALVSDEVGSIKAESASSPSMSFVAIVVASLSIKLVDGMTRDPSDSHRAGYRFHPIELVAKDDADVETDEEATLSTLDGCVDGKVASEVEEDALHILPLKYFRLLMPYPPSVNRVSDAIST